MIRIDSRIGSSELAPYFTPYGIRPVVTRLEFGDVEFTGRGPKGECMVGFERKRITDLLDSIRTRRLSGHQLIGMAEHFDYVYLMVEGIWRPGPNDEVEISGPTPQYVMSYRQVDNYLATLELKSGIIYRRTSNPRETVCSIVNLYRWWNDKDWVDHESHQQVYAPADAVEGRKFSLLSRKPTVLERVCMQLPGLDSRARKVAEHFTSLREMALADEKAWRDVPGVGKIGAKRIVEAINGSKT